MKRQNVEEKIVVLNKSQKDEILNNFLLNQDILEFMFKI